MALDVTAEGFLSLASLVTVEEDLQPYVWEWSSVPDAGDWQGGFLLAVPPSFIPQSVLDRASQGVEAGPIGASTVAIVRCGGG